MPAPVSMSLSRFHFLSQLQLQEMGRPRGGVVSSYDVQCAQSLATCRRRSWTVVWPWAAGLARLLPRQRVPVRGGSECRCGALSFSWFCLCLCLCPCLCLCVCVSLSPASPTHPLNKLSSSHNPLHTLVHTSCSQEVKHMRLRIVAFVFQLPED